MTVSKGYFSYTDNDRHNCVFFSADSVPKITISIGFDDTFLFETAVVDTTAREMTSLENDLYTIRQKAIAESVNDTVVFKHYTNTNLNYIPLIVGKEKKVYILTGTNTNGLVIFGNDYLITFDKKNRIKSKKGLHKNIIPIEYGDNTDV